MSDQWLVKNPDFHRGIRFQSSFTITWELEDKNFLKMGIIDSLKYRIMAIKTNENFIPFSNSVTFRRNRTGNRFWIDTRNTRLLLVKVKCPNPGVASHDQKPHSRIVSGIKSPPLARTPPPPTGFTLIGA